MSGKRDVLAGDIRQMPVPDFSECDLSRLEQAVADYLAAAQSIPPMREDNRQTRAGKKASRQKTFDGMADSEFQKSMLLENNSRFFTGESMPRFFVSTIFPLPWSEKFSTCSRAFAGEAFLSSKPNIFRRFYRTRPIERPSGHHRGLAKNQPPPRQTHRSGGGRSPYASTSRGIEESPTAGGCTSKSPSPRSDGGSRRNHRRPQTARLMARVEPTVPPYAYPPRRTVVAMVPPAIRITTATGPGLKDDFSFRCVYCLKRVVWTPTDIWTVDHLLSRHDAPIWNASTPTLFSRANSATDKRGLIAFLIHARSPMTHVCVSNRMAASLRSMPRTSPN